MKNLVLASYNIHKCVGVDKKFDPYRIIKVIKELNADILVLQETDKRFGNRIGLLDLEHLKTETHFAYVPIKAMSMQGHGWHGNAIFIKHKKALGIKVIDSVHITLPGVEPRGALLLEVLFPFGPLRILAAHFGLLRHSRVIQTEKLITILRTRAPMPTLLAGDFNEWRTGKKSSLIGFENFFDIKIEALPSFPSRYPLFALDRIFSYPADIIQNIEVHSSNLARMASDHLPIKAYLNPEKVPYL